MSLSRSCIIVGLLVALAPAAWAAKKEPAKPDADPNRIINESYQFLREREPDMTETEFALYEKVVPMISAQPDFALRLLEGMVAEADSSAAFEFVLGNVYFEQRKYAEAEARFKLAVEKFSTFARAWDNLGVLYFTTERYAEAVPAFTKAITLGMTEARLYGLLAFCQLKSGNPLAAEASYLQAFSIDSDNADWIEGLLTSYLESDQHARAETLLRQLTRLKPTDSRFWMLLGNTLVSQERPLDAIAVLETAMSFGVLDADGSMILGDLYTSQRMNAEAVRTYQSLASKNVDLGLERLVRLANALISENQLAAASDVLTTAASLAKGDQRAPVLQASAEIHLTRQEWDRAKPLLEEVLTIDPMNGKALIDLGSLEETLGEDSRALFLFDSATQVPDHAYTANLKLANLQVKLERFTQALTSIDRALALRKSTSLSEFRARVQAMAPDSEE